VFDDDDELDAISTALTLSTFKYIKKNRIDFQTIEQGKRLFPKLFYQ
jgi:hypothetical protein